MNTAKILTSITLACLAVSLTACETIRNPNEVRTKCTINDQGETECSVEAVWKSSSPYNNLQYLLGENVEIDLEESTSSFLGSSSRTATVTAMDGSSVLGVKSSTYNLSGYKVTAQFESDVVNWLSSYNGQADEIVHKVYNLDFANSQGTNTVTAEVMHDNVVLAGSSDSWYVGPNGPVIIDPSNGY